MSKQQLQVLEEILQSDIDFLEKIRAISDTIKSLVGADRCTIFIHDPKLCTFWSAYIEGISYIELPDNTGIVHEVFHRNEIRRINNVQTTAVYNESTEKETGYVINTMIAAPIIDEMDKPIGVIQVINKTSDPKGFDGEDEQVVIRLMRHIQRFTMRLRG